MDRKKVGVYLLWIIFFCFLLDTFLTYYAVHFLKVAGEGNPFVVFLWDNLGLFWGELVRYLLVGGLFILLINRLDSKNQKASRVAFGLIIFVLFVWSLVICNNLWQLWGI